MQPTCRWQRASALTPHSYEAGESFAFWSDDNGQTFEKGASVGVKGTSECQVAPLAVDHNHADGIARTTGKVAMGRVAMWSRTHGGGHKIM